MAGHLHPLIIPLVTETVWMAGNFTNFDASWAVSHSNPIGLQSALETH